jgi:hypothetical protein
MKHFFVVVQLTYDVLPVFDIIAVLFFTSGNLAGCKSPYVGFSVGYWTVAYTRGCVLKLSLTTRLSVLREARAGGDTEGVL